MRSITCTNKTTNVSITFGEDSFSPFLLASTDGIYKSSNTVFMSDNTMTDGATYQGSIAEKRNIVLYVMDNPQSKDFIYDQRNRDLLYNLFRKGDQGTLTYTENGSKRMIDYYCEGISRANKKSRLFTISLICPDPKFRDEGHIQYIADWLSDFEFIHEFIEEGEEISHKSNTRMTTIINDTASSNIGLEFTLDISGPVANPSISLVETDQILKVGSSGRPLNLILGDKLIITTATNNKHVKLVRDGVTTEVNGYLTENSEFMQLQYGPNTIAYNADSGVEHVSITIRYAYEFEGA